MRKKVLGLSLAILFFGSIASSTFAMATSENVSIVVVDDDKDKTKAKKAKSKDYEAKKECCNSAKAKSCDEKKVEKNGGDKR